MTDLDSALETARGADPASRILLRDRIAAHSGAAIGPMTVWAVDGRLGAFAVRVLERIGADPASHEAVVAALVAVNRQNSRPRSPVMSLTRSLA
jgi:hypothetical protein